MNYNNTFSKMILMVILITSALLSQSFLPDTPSVMREYRRLKNQNVINTVGFSSYGLLVGKYWGTDSIFARLLYQWEIPETAIPDNSIIDSVEIIFEYNKSDEDIELSARFYSIDRDITGLNQSEINTVWDGMSSPNPELFICTGDDDTLKYISRNPNSPLNSAIRASLVNNRFTLGIRWANEYYTHDYFWMIFGYYVKLKVYFTPSQVNVTFNQLLQNSTQVGTLRKYEDVALGEEFSPGTTFTLNINDTVMVQGDLREYSNQKFNNWNNLPYVENHHLFPIIASSNYYTSHFISNHYNIKVKNAIEGFETVNNGEIHFKDPWYRDTADVNYPDIGGNGIVRNRGLDAIFHKVASPLDFSLSQYSDYQGVFFDKDIYLGYPYYSVKSQNVQNINLGTGLGYRNCYFQNWTSTGTDALQNNLVNGYYESPVVFRSEGAVIKANLKGIGLSNDMSAYVNNSQRKFIRTPDGKLHKVYDSMGHVWYETSVDNGATWELINDARPLDTNGGKNPSIAFYPFESEEGATLYKTIVVFQQNNSANYKIRAATFLTNPLDPTFVIDKIGIVDIYSSTEQASINANPVLDIDFAGHVVVIWENKQGSGGLYARTGQIGISVEPGIGYYLPSFYATVVLNGTDANSKNPAIAVNKINEYHIFQLVWEQGTASSSIINYCTLQSNLTMSAITNMSNSGYLLNYRPSVFAMVSGGARVSWIGDYNGTGSIVRSVYHDPGYYRYWAFGDNVRSTSNNWSDNNVIGAIGWSQVNGNQFSNYVVATNVLANPVLLNTSGKHIQMSNGNSGSMCVSSYISHQEPYYFQTSTNLTFQKPGRSISGRGFTAIKNDAQFNYAITNVEVGDQNINFKYLNQNEDFRTLEKINKVLITDPFMIEENTHVTFSDMLGVRDSSSAINALGENGYLNYRVDLLDNESDLLLGTLKNIRVNAADLVLLRTANYQVSTQDLVGKTVKIRILITSNLEDLDFALVENCSDANTINKNSYENIEIENSTVVKEYKVEQNYPNPFNPSTTIKYQIPKSGMVSLVVYDILGNEVAKLVNEEKPMGRYEVNFNASNLASGVYIYQLKSQNYISSKKMLLIK